MSEVVMTHAEREVLMPVVPPGVRLDFVPHADSRFTRLQTPGGCPLLSRDEHGLAVCTVHAVRPYNCRRWMCGRFDACEPVDMSPVPMIVLKDRNLRRQYARLQNQAQAWALAHGWERES